MLRPCGELCLMLRDVRYILKGGFIHCYAYGSATAILLPVSDVDISLAIFLIQSSCLHRASVVSKHFLLFQHDTHRYKTTGILKQLKWKLKLSEFYICVRHVGTIKRIRTVNHTTLRRGNLQCKSAVLFLTSKKNCIIVNRHRAENGSLETWRAL